MIETGIRFNSGGGTVPQLDHFNDPTFSELTHDTTFPTSEPARREPLQEPQTSKKNVVQARRLETSGHVPTDSNAARGDIDAPALERGNQNSVEASGKVLRNVTSKHLTELEAPISKDAVGLDETPAISQASYANGFVTQFPGKEISESHKRKHGDVDLGLSPYEKEKVPKLSSHLLRGQSFLALQASRQANNNRTEIAFSKYRHPGDPHSPESGGRLNSASMLLPEQTGFTDEPVEIAEQKTPLNDPADRLNLTVNTRNTRPTFTHRTLSTPVSTNRSQSPRKHANSQPQRPRESGDEPRHLHIDASKILKSPLLDGSVASPMPPSLPLPPFSIPLYLQLELSSHRPAQHHIHRSATSDFPYESSRVKIERLLNFLFLPPHLETVLLFGTLACLDAWLYTFTILPLRLCKSFYILGQSWMTNLAAELQYIAIFIYNGTGRMWRRRRTRTSSASKPTMPSLSTSQSAPDVKSSSRPRHARHHRRNPSVPSTLLPDDKADILRGFLIICTCLILLRFDASRMYHWIRGQATIKLYVIYNVLEVCDRLFSAIGQDVLECLFSRETLERKPDGHSKVLRPFWLFVLALMYTTIHATALFYQVITLNVAVNSYSNALITLLMSNQFVEIKSTVFKKFEKENLFQLTCADVVERFQLWLMLTIIASRNIVETGGLNIGISALSSPFTSTNLMSNSTSPVSSVSPPRLAASIIPSSFTWIPDLFSSVSAFAPAVGNVLAPFLVVLGSEMLVDWIKHAYINKFNNTRPSIYGRYLDVLAKDYYTNAFGDQNLTKRLGLPVIPLSCLFIRASVQTYHMFIAAWGPSASSSHSPSLASIHQQFTVSQTSMPTSTASTLSSKFDDLLGRIPSTITGSRLFSNITTILVVVLGFLVLLAFKLVLGMVLLSFARSRYGLMKEREKGATHQVEGGKRIGGWGMVEVDEDKRRWIYEDDAVGLRTARERDEREKLKQERGVSAGFDRVKRYEMAAKRIW